MRFSTLAGAALFAGASAAKNYLGFNSGSTFPDYSAKFKKDFVAEFETAQKLVNAPGLFNSVRLYSNIQAYSAEDPIQAFEAAIDTKTYLLLGIWTSGTDNIDKELNALTTAIKKYGTSLTDLIIGMSIGSEDLYRDSATGRENKAGVGASPDTIVGFIKSFRKAFADTPLSKVPVGHVDTWDAWVNGTNKAVLDAVDWVGVDEYPFYETGKGNAIENAGNRFDQAYDKTVAAAGGKPVWVTETGWPTSGPTWDQAVPSVNNAKKYWDEVGCRQLFNKAPTFWYNLRDSNPDNKVKFGISPELSTTPVFDLTCPDHFDTSSHTSQRSESTTSSHSSNATSASPTSTGAANPSSTESSSGSAQTTGSLGVVPSVIPGNSASAAGFSRAALAGVALTAGYVALL